MAKSAKALKVKRSCCKSKPRCKRCPVVMKRLVVLGLAEPTGKRTFELSDRATKSQIKAARGR